MRSLKFRAWDTVTSKMSPPFALFGEFTLLGAVHDWQHEMGHTAKTSLDALGSLEVMQSTGLFDKNGKEIFELDKISFDINFSEPKHRAYWSVSGFNGVVRFGKFGWEIKDIVFEKMYDPDYVFSSKVGILTKSILKDIQG